MILTDSQGRNLPLFIEDYERVSIASEDFSPSEDPSLTASQVGVYCDKGFLVRPHTDGDFYGITWYRYHNNKDSVDGLSALPYDGIANQWIECRFVKVTTASTATSITVGT